MGMSGTERSVLDVLSGHMITGGSSVIGQQEIADYLKIRRDVVAKAIVKLKARNIVEKTKYKGKISYMVAPEAQWAYLGAIRDNIVDARSKKRARDKKRVMKDKTDKLRKQVNDEAEQESLPVASGS